LDGRRAGGKRQRLVGRRHPPGELAVGRPASPRRTAMAEQHGPPWTSRGGATSIHWWP
jgi:hypothetical protein